MYTRTSARPSSGGKPASSRFGSSKKVARPFSSSTAPRSGHNFKSKPAGAGHVTSSRPSFGRPASSHSTTHRSSADHPSASHAVSSRPSSARPSASHSTSPRGGSSYAGRPSTGYKSSSYSSRPSGGSHSSYSSRRPSSGGSRFSHAPKRGRFQSERIDFSRFIRKAETSAEEVKYVSKHTFSDFPFVPRLMENIAKKGFIHPMPIQDQAIMSGLEGKDLFGLANTGTGKTAAFLLPLIDRVSRDKKQQVLILAPTRELALQIELEFRELAGGMGIYSAACVGGLPIMRQVDNIRRGVHFVIGTPGRIKDLIDRKSLDLSNYKNVVLDEADRMLDMGFRDDLTFILGRMPTERHTLFFSATLSPEIKKMTEQYLKHPVFISVVTRDTAKSIEQNVVRVRGREEKLTALHDILIKDGSDKVLIFRETKRDVDALETELRSRGFKVGAIHGDKRNRDRIRILDSFKKNVLNILIATDVAARGLDIPDVTHVINFDVPQTYDTYVHRIGRTGRGTKKGTALTFVPA